MEEGVGEEAPELAVIEGLDIKVEERGEVEGVEPEGGDILEDEEEDIGDEDEAEADAGSWRVGMGVLMHIAS